MPELTQEQIETLKNFEDFLKKAEISPQLPVVDELRLIKKLLTALLDKEYPEFPTIPEPLPFPEIPTTDMTETNFLLKSLLDKEVEIDVKLDVR
jgi:hypothetical protein